MAYNTISDLFKGICDALRNKTGITGLINHQDIPSRIDEIVISNGGVDTSDADATEEDMVERKSAYVNGKKIIGSIPIWTSINWQTPTASWDETNKRLQLKDKITARRFLEKESPSTMYCSGDKLGTATPADVRKNTTFTSMEGLCIPGEWEPATNDGGGVDTTISTNGAESNDIINGKRAWVNDTLVVGDMARLNNGNGFNNCTPSIKSEKLYLDSPDLSSRRWIEAGDHIFLSTPASNLGDADPSQVLKDVTFTSSKGLMQTGTYVPSTNTEIDGNLVEENIKAGVTINGVTGTFTNDADATDKDIASGKIAYVNGQKIEGKLPEVTNFIAEAQMVTSQTDGSSINFVGLDTFTEDTILRYDQTSLFPGFTTLQLPQIEWENAFGTATPADVIKGKTFTSVSGLLVEGEHECTGGIDTSDATATPEDLAKDITAYVNGVKVTGNVTTVNNGKYAVAIAGIPYVYDDDLYACDYQFQSGILFKTGSKFITKQRPERFGDATAEDVIKGRFFTSASGLNVEGSLMLNGEHVWQKYDVSNQNWTYTSELLGTEKPSDATGTAKDSFTVTTDGRFELSETAATLGGYFASSSNNGTVIYYSKWVYVYNGDSYYEYYKYTITSSSGNEKGNIIGCVTSNNASDYPNNGVKNGYWYTKLQSGEVNNGSSSSSPSGDSLVSKKGTTTSATINTGLSEVKAFFIDCAANSGAGLCTLSWSSDLEYMTVYGRSSYTQSIQRVATSGNSYISFSGGTVNIIGSTNYAFRSDITYSWVAIGTE